MSTRDWDHGPGVRRFWDQVTTRASADMPDDHWVWCGPQTDGYGLFTVGGSTVYAHVYAWEARWGPAPAGMAVVHRCRDRRCVRISHLGLAGHADGEASGRRSPPSGAGNASRRTVSERAWRGSRLTWSSAAEIRAKYAAGGVTHRALARQFGVGETTIRRVLNGETWIPADDSRHDQDHSTSR